MLLLNIHFFLSTQLSYKIAKRFYNLTQESCDHEGKTLVERKKGHGGEEIALDKPCKWPYFLLITVLHRRSRFEEGIYKD